MSQSVKFPFWISIDELKSIERLANGSASIPELAHLQMIDFAHFRNVVYRLRQAFAGAPQTKPEGSSLCVTDDSKPPGATPVEPPASDRSKTDPGPWSSGAWPTHLGEP